MLASGDVLPALPSRLVSTQIKWPMTADTAFEARTKISTPMLLDQVERGVPVGLPGMETDMLRKEARDGGAQRFVPPQMVVSRAKISKKKKKERGRAEISKKKKKERAESFCKELLLGGPVPGNPELENAVSKLTSGTESANVAWLRSFNKSLDCERMSGHAHVQKADDMFLQKFPQSCRC